MKNSIYRRIFCLLLALCLVAPMLTPLRAQAEGEATVYLDPAAGADTNSGLTQDAPVKTLAAAYEALTQGGQIVLLSDLSWTKSGFFPECTYPVTITSATGAEGIAASANMRMQGETTFRDLTLTFNNTGMMMISGEGHDLTIDTGVTVVRNTSNQVNLTATSRYAANHTADLTLTVRSGNWSFLYATHSNTVTGNVNVVVEGGECATISPAYNGTVSGNVNISVSNAEVTSLLTEPNYGAGNVSALNIDLLPGAQVTQLTTSSGTVGSTAVNLQGGTVGKMTGAGTLTLSSGKVTGANSGFTTAIDVPAEQTLTIAGAVTADTLTCAGTLNFEGSGTLEAKAVTGTVSCTITGEILAYNPFVTAPAESGIVFPEGSNVVNYNGQWMINDVTRFKGLLIKADSDVEMIFYTGHEFAEEDEIQPNFVETVDTQTYYYFPGMEGYCGYTAKRTGDYTVHQRVYVTAAEAETCCVEEVVMEAKANSSMNEWDHSYYYGQTDEFIQQSENDPNDRWHTIPLVTPVFTNEDKPAHQMTTQKEMKEFIASLDDEQDNMYVFSMGQSAKHRFDIPLVFFTKTDLSDCTTLEEAAEALAQDGLPNVGYKAQMHGDEHAAGEGALNVIHMLDQEENQYLLDTVNIYVMPRINPDGAYECQRNLRSQSIIYPDVGISTDPNRNGLTLAMHEARLYLRTVQLFDPIAELDGHERQRGTNIADNQIGCSWRYGSGQEMLELQTELVLSMFAAMEDVDLSAAWYTDVINSTPGDNTRQYATAQSRIHLLMETRGIYLGNECYESRTVSHIVCAMQFLKYCAANADKIEEISSAQQDALVTAGKTYEEEDVIILAASGVEAEEYKHTTEKFNFANGTVSDSVRVPKFNVPTRTRVAPTAYVIPTDLPRIDEILELLQLHEIEYYALPANAAISLQQYSGTVDEDRVTSNVTLSTEQPYAFPAGAYVIQMDQRNGYVAALLMEPDASSTDLVQQGRIALNADGTFPIYRYIQDLTEDDIGIAYTFAAEAPQGLTAVAAGAAANGGAITGLSAELLYEYKAAGADTYTALAAGTTEITDLTPGTYFVRFQAVDGVISNSAECVISGDVTVYLNASTGSDTNAGTEAAPVATLEGAYAALDAILHTAGEASTGTIILVDDYTITRNARVDLPEHIYHVSILGATKDVVLTFNPTNMVESAQQIAFHGPTTVDHLTFHAASTAKIDYIYACGNKVTFGADITVTSARKSTFPRVVGGDYKTPATDTDLTVLGGKWDAIYASSFYSGHTGTAKLTVKDATTVLVAVNYYGNISGDTQLSLTGVTADNPLYLGTYSSSTSYANTNTGDVTLVLGADNEIPAIYTGSNKKGSMEGTVTVIADGADLSALTLYNTPGTQNTTGTVAKGVLVYASGNAIPVEGFHETHIITRDTVTLQADLAVDHISGTGSVELNGYALTGDGSYAMDMAIETVSLRPTCAGVYFTSEFTLQQTLTDAVFGIALSTKDVTPYAKDGTNSLYAEGYNSVLVDKIMKVGATTNKANGRSAIYARPYVKLADGTVIYGQTVSVSLMQVVVAADAAWATLTQVQKDGLLSFYSSFSADVATWSLPNIRENA